MGKINSKQKGARFERLLASMFRDFGFEDSRRTAQYCGNTGDASDVIGLPGIHAEILVTMRFEDFMKVYKEYYESDQCPKKVGVDNG